MNCQVSGLIKAILLKGLPTVFQSLSGPNMDSLQSSFIKLQVKEQKHFCNKRTFSADYHEFMSRLNGSFEASSR